jgi:hypothetical protein
MQFFKNNKQVFADFRHAHKGNGWWMSFFLTQLFDLNHYPFLKQMNILCET